MMLKLVHCFNIKQLSEYDLMVNRELDVHFLLVET
jgi:hypothetical protein